MTVAVAGIAHSSWKTYGPVNGYTYKNQATVVTQSGQGAWAATGAYTTDGRNTPAGYIGCLARLYNGAGNVMASSGWYYTPSSASGLSKVTNPPVTNHGNYYSQGQSRAWSGSSYNTYNTNVSPQQSYQG